MKKILFIEDESALQKTLGEALRDRGYEVTAALDGELGLKLALKNPPDLILLDLILPKLSGFDVLKELKARAETKNIPVIVLTNLGELSDIDKAMELGANSYLVKADYNLDEVVEKIEKTLMN